MDIAQLKRDSREFSKRLVAAKKEVADADFPWYPYGTLYNFDHLDGLLRGANRDLRNLIGDEPVADVGAADGELAFFLESQGLEVDVVDFAPTNYNSLRGVNLLKSNLQSSIAIHERNLDSYFDWPRPGYGLVFLLGILYHLKNPFYVLESLSRVTRHAFISTRIAQYAADRTTRIETSAVAYLLDSDESNNDATNFWIFSDAGLKRILHRTGWDVVDYLRVGNTSRSDPASAKGDERAFALIKSRHF